MARRSTLEEPFCNNGFQVNTIINLISFNDVSLIAFINFTLKTWFPRITGYLRNMFFLFNFLGFTIATRNHRICTCKQMKEETSGFVAFLIINTRDSKEVDACHVAYYMPMNRDCLSFCGSFQVFFCF